ncbi:hypothetical protein Tco_0606912 [Tanacetum coccineum]
MDPWQPFGGKQTSSKVIDSKFTLEYEQSNDGHDFFVEYTVTRGQHFRDKLYYSNTWNALGHTTTVQDDSTGQGIYNADDAIIQPIYDEELMAEVQLTAECNIFAIGQQHIEQPEIIVEDLRLQNQDNNLLLANNAELKATKKKIQERDRNSTTSVPTSARIQTTTDDRKPNPRSNNQTSRSLPVDSYSESYSTLASSKVPYVMSTRKISEYGADKDETQKPCQSGFPPYDDTEK